MDDFERLATHEELDREPAGRELSDFQTGVVEFGHFDEDGGTLSRADFEDARANL